MSIVRKFSFFFRLVCNLFQWKFNDKWIDRSNSIFWAPWCSDLTLSDCFCRDTSKRYLIYLDDINKWNRTCNWTCSMFNRNRFKWSSLFNNMWKYSMETSRLSTMWNSFLYNLYHKMVKHKKNEVSLIACLFIYFLLYHQKLTLSRSFRMMHSKSMRWYVVIKRWNVLIVY